MDKCKWDGLDFEPCDALRRYDKQADNAEPGDVCVGEINLTTLQFKSHTRGVGSGVYSKYGKSKWILFDFCPFCGTNVMHPNVSKLQEIIKAENAT
jgi:hypothetical protein